MQSNISTREDTDRIGAHPVGAVGAPESAEEEMHEHIHLPPPSIWPLSTAAGVSIIGLGLVTTTLFSFLGLALMIYSIYEWVQELRHELH